MGFTIAYRSTRPVTSAEAESIQQAARAANEGRTWLSCEPVLFRTDSDGHLFGTSKPNFMPDPDDAESARSENLPDGTTRDVIDILCSLSLAHRLDWALSHDYDPDLGHIRAGVCDANALGQIEAIGELGSILEELDLEEDDFPG